MLNLSNGGYKNLSNLISHTRQYRMTFSEINPSVSDLIETI
ncbi:MAG: hypothetical protein PWP37_1718 [Thermotogota bacterium]|nr:hypothetical protein [Thermotogota bacterium]